MYIQAITGSGMISILLELAKLANALNVPF